MSANCVGTFKQSTCSNTYNVSIKTMCRNWRKCCFIPTFTLFASRNTLGRMFYIMFYTFEQAWYGFMSLINVNILCLWWIINVISFRRSSECKDSKKYTKTIIQNFSKGRDILRLPKSQWQRGNGSIKTEVWKPRASYRNLK